MTVEIIYVNIIKYMSAIPNLSHIIQCVLYLLYTVYCIHCMHTTCNDFGKPSENLYACTTYGHCLTITYAQHIRLSCPAQVHTIEHLLQIEQ